MTVTGRKGVNLLLSANRGFACFQTFKSQVFNFEKLTGNLKLYNYIQTVTHVCVKIQFNMYDALQMKTVFSYILNTKLYFSI